MRIFGKNSSFVVLLFHVGGSFSLYSTYAQTNTSTVSSSLSSSMTSTAGRRLQSSYTPLTDSNIQLAAYLWVTNNTAALSTYGDIQDWDTSGVTDMRDVFGYFNGAAYEAIGTYVPWSTSFNGNISAWNTSQVTSINGIQVRSQL